MIDAVRKAYTLQAQAVEAAAGEGLCLVFEASGRVSLIPYAEDDYQIVAL